MSGKEYGRQESQAHTPNSSNKILEPSFYQPNNPPTSNRQTSSSNTNETDGQSNRSEEISSAGNNPTKNGNISGSNGSNLPAKRNSSAEANVLDLTDQMIQFDGFIGYIRAKIHCGNYQFYAIETGRRMTGQNGRCPSCDQIHARFENPTHGYYASVEEIHKKYNDNKNDKERAQGPKSVDALKAEQQNTLPLSEPVIGRNKGIEGDANSCYMDSTIFCMFAYSGVFDSLLNKKIQDKNIRALQTLLRENIVNVLRGRAGFVERDALYNLRLKLSDATGDKSFREEEKDPTEFLRALETLFDFAPLKTIPPDQLPNDNKSNITANIMWEMFDANFSQQKSTNIGSIFRNSLAEIPVKLATIPPFLILIAPRHSRTERSYRYIIPDRQIILDHQMVQLICEKCNKINHDRNDTNNFYHCYDCQPRSLTPSTEAVVVSRCFDCISRKHDTEEKRTEHRLRQVKTIATLNLFAVLCIERCHYVAFVKCEKSNNDHEWLFFDSMSDRVGNTKNIPSVTRVNGFEKWIKDAETDKEYFDKMDGRRNSGLPLAKAFEGDEMKKLRLFRDGAFFFYENPAANYQ